MTLNPLYLENCLSVSFLQPSFCCGIGAVHRKRRRFRYSGSSDQVGEAEQTSRHLRSGNYSHRNRVKPAGFTNHQARYGGLGTSQS
jgi:hypothetical protein